MTGGLHPREDERLAALEALGLVGTPSEERFDRITSMASRQLGVPISLIGLVAGDRQWNKSVLGLSERDVPLTSSICRHVVADDAPLVVPDLTQDPRFADNAFVVNGARFYAGWPLRDGEGLPLGTLCVLDDEPRQLTREQHELMHSLAEWAQAELNAEALRRALAEVRSSEQRMRRLLDEAPAAVLVVSVDGLVEYANGPALRLFGGERDGSLDGTPVSVLLPSVDVNALEGQGRRRSDGQLPGHRSVQRGTRRDGSSFPAELTVSVTGGVRSRFIVFVRDLGEDQTITAQLAELRQRTEVAFDALAEGVLVAEPDGRLSFGNLAAAQLLQRRRSDLPGASWHGMIHQVDDADEPCQLVDPLALAGRTISPVELRRADGTTLPVEISVRMLHGLSPAPGVVVTLHDLTERLRADRLKNELVSAVSHELRTPLTSIRGSLSLLRAKVVDPASEQGARMIEVATTSTERLSRLVNDILDLERLRAGKVELVLTRQRVAMLLLQAAQAVSGAAVAAGVRVEVLDGDERVVADTDRVVQILVNLLGNAVKFSPRGSTATLSARRVGDRVLLSVADQGRGIPPEELERIFDPFSQVDSGDSRKYEGTGLGLAIARGLAEQHGGTLSATSAVDEGSTFVLSLPAEAEQRRRVAYAPASQVPHGLAQVLAGRGWEAVPVGCGGLAASGAGAVLLAPADAPEVVTTCEEAAALALPLLMTASSQEQAVGTGPEVLETAVRGRVLVVVDDDHLAQVLITGLGRRGLAVSHAAAEDEALAAVAQQRPDLVVLDLRLSGGAGFAVLDRLHGPSPLTGPPPAVCGLLVLDEDERRRLQAGAAEPPSEGLLRLGDVVADVVRLGRDAGALHHDPEEQG